MLIREIRPDALQASLRTLDDIRALMPRRNCGSNISLARYLRPCGISGSRRLIHGQRGLECRDAGNIASLSSLRIYRGEIMRGV